MVSFGCCGQIILLYESVWGMKTTEFCLRFNILNKKGHAGTLNWWEQNFFNHNIQILLPFLLYNQSLLENITHLLCSYIDLHTRMLIWSVLVVADKYFYYMSQSEVWKLLNFVYDSIF